MSEGPKVLQQATITREYRIVENPMDGRVEAQWRGGGEKEWHLVPGGGSHYLNVVARLVSRVRELEEQVEGRWSEWRNIKDYLDPGVIEDE